MVGNAFHNTSVNTDKFLAGHTWFTWKTTGDNHNIRTSSCAIIIGYTLNNGDPATLWNNGEWDWAKFMEYLRTAQAAFGAAETSGMYA
ncbi:MAG: hypothetical protein IJ989_05195, partial [Paludibacteraceae bacterium]|nr:hypothetical protein [Paludibacteraceae bacterium]